MPKNIIISNEEEALKFLERASNDQISDIQMVSFSGWPNLEIVIIGEDYSSSLKTTQLKALIKLQDSIYYQYELIKNKSLSNDEKKALELKINVRNGSSDLLVELTKLFNTLLTKETPSTEVIIGAVVLAAIYGSVKIASNLFDHKEKVLEIDNEKRLLDIIRNLTNKNDLLGKLVDSANHSLTNLSKCAPDSNELLINKAKTSHLSLIKKTKKKKTEKASTYSLGKSYELKCTLVGIKDEGKGRYECRFKDVDSDEILTWKQKKSDIAKSLDHKLRMEFSSKKNMSITAQFTKLFRSGGEISISKIFDRKPRNFKNIKHIK